MAFNSVFLFLSLFLFRWLPISFCPRILSLYSLLNFSLNFLSCSVLFHFPSPLHLCPLLSCLLFDPCCFYFKFIHHLMLCYVMWYLGTDNADNDDTDDDDDNALWPGTRVEGDRKGKGTWYPGVISCDRSVNQCISQWVSQSVHQSVSVWVSQSVSASVSQSVSDSVSESASHSVIGIFINLALSNNYVWLISTSLLALPWRYFNFNYFFSFSLHVHVLERRVRSI